jgi:hypothetical protein
MEAPVRMCEKLAGSIGGIKINFNFEAVFIEN